MTFAYKLERKDGSPAEPPTFKTAVPNWGRGDIIPARPRENVSRGRDPARLRAPCRSGPSGRSYLTRTTTAGDVDPGCLRRRMGPDPIRGLSEIWPISSPRFGDLSKIDRSRARRKVVRGCPLRSRRCSPSGRAAGMSLIARGCCNRATKSAILFLKKGRR
jgi:hypothetical protein